MMSTVLVTGGTGSLGRKLVPALLGAGYRVRVMSHRDQPAEDASPVEWAQADLRSGEDLSASVDGIEILVHAATNVFNPKVDVQGTKLLLESAAAAGVQHFLYPSIVGIDSNPFPYYRSKLAAERLVEGGKVPWTILRATQFHSLIDRFLKALAHFPWMLLPEGLRFQSVAEEEFARQILGWVGQAAGGRVADLGGPQVQTSVRMAELWLASRGLQRKILEFPIPGKAAQAFRRGDPLLKQGTKGKITWEEWLRQTYGAHHFDTPRRPTRSS
jgi:uncharacterized protein YbjT (DUF2867 family)